MKEILLLSCCFLIVFSATIKLSTLFTSKLHIVRLNMESRRIVGLFLIILGIIHPLLSNEMDKPNLDGFPADNTSEASSDSIESIVDSINVTAESSSTTVDHSVTQVGKVTEDIRTPHVIPTTSATTHSRGTPLHRNKR